MNQNRIRYLTDNFAATPGELAMLRPEGRSDTSFYIGLLKLRGRRDEEASYLRLIAEECGKTENDVRKEIEFMSSLNLPAEISLERYLKYSAYTLHVLKDKKALVQWSGKLSRYLLLRDRIIQKIEIERMPFSAYEKELEEVRILLSEMLSKGRKKELIGKIKSKRPDLSENTAAYDEIAVDM